MSKIDISMQNKGVLEVDKVADKAGSSVFINGHAVGLASQLSDFTDLGVKVEQYQQALSKLSAMTTGKTSHKPQAISRKAKPPRLGAPEWNGD